MAQAPEAVWSGAGMEGLEVLALVWTLTATPKGGGVVVPVVIVEMEGEVLQRSLAKVVVVVVGRVACWDIHPAVEVVVSAY